MSFRLSSAQKRKKTATKVADVTRRQTKISEYFAKSDCAKFSETKEIMTSEPECVYLSSSDEEVPNKQPRLSDATSVQWTGKLRSVQKKPIQSSITTCLGKNNTECDVSVGTSKRRLTINRKNTDTAVASSSSSSREDSGSPCQSSISKFISSCEAFLTPSTEKIRKKLHKLYGLSPNLKEEIGKFIVTVCPIRRENVFTKIKMVLDEVRKCEASAENGEKTPKEAELLPPLDEVLESKLKKMDKAMTRIHSKIKELREREVDLDDEDNSCYLLEERLTQKFLKIHGMYCKLQGAPAKFKSSKIRFEGSKYPGLNQAIQTFLIKRKEAPDFADILKIVKSFNSQLKLNDSLLQQLAQDCFKKSVEVMKLARVGQHWDSLHGYVDDTPTSIPDQLTKDEELQRKLQENMKLGEENLEKVLNAYATQQEDLKLEPEEYDSGEESPNDDEDGEGTNAIGDKESEDGNSDILILEEEEENELKTEKAKDKCFAEEDKIWKNKDKLELVDALELEPTVESRPTKVLTDSEECKDILNISDEEDDVTFIHQAEHQSSDLMLCVSEDDADSEL